MSHISARSSSLKGNIDKAILEDAVNHLARKHNIEVLKNANAGDYYNGKKKCDFVLSGEVKDKKMPYDAIHYGMGVTIENEQLKFYGDFDMNDSQAQIQFAQDEIVDNYRVLGLKNKLIDVGYSVELDIDNCRGEAQMAF